MKRARIRKRICGVLLACAMMLTLLPATAFAADTAITATTAKLTTGSYILNEDVTLENGPLTVPSGAEVALNLESDKTLTNQDGQHTIVVENGGSLTITGSGTVDNVSHAKAAIWNEGTVILNGGSYTRSQEKGASADDAGGNSYYVLVNHGTMTINGGVSVTQKGHFSSLVENGYYNYGSGSANDGYVEGINAANPTLTITGGTFNGGLNTVKNDDGAILTIEDGSFSNYTQAVVQNHNVTTINGGTFTAGEASGTTYGVDNCGCVAGTDQGTLTITGGTFTNATYGVWDRSSLSTTVVTISGGSFTATNSAVAAATSSHADISITGGTFSSDVSDYLAEDYVQNSNGIVGTLDEVAVAQINEEKYNTLSAAIDEAKSGDIVSLLQDTDDSSLTVPEGIQLTLNLGGHTLSMTGSTSVSDAAYAKGTAASLINEGNLTIQNGTIKGEASNTIINKEGAGLTLASDVNITTSSSAGACTVINLGGTVTTSANITNAVGDGIVTYGGTLDVTGGSITVTSASMSPITVFNRAYNNESAGATVTMEAGTLKGNAYAISTNNLYSGGDTPSNVTITGGSITAAWPAIYWPSSGKLTIGNSDGTGPDITSTAGSAVEVCSGTLIINGGNFVGQGQNGPTDQYLAEGYRTHSGGAGPGDAVTIIAHRANGYISAPLNVTIAGGTFSSKTEYAVRYLDCNEASGATQIEQTVNVSITGGNFAGALQDIEATYVADDAKRIVTGGTFSSDPSAYVTSDYVALVQNGQYVVQEKSEDAAPAEVVAGAPTSDVSAIPEASREAVKEAVDAIQATGLTGEANAEANTNTVTAAAGAEAINADPDIEDNVDENDVTIVVQPYLDIKATEYSTSETANSLTLDITPMVRTVATTANLDNNEEIYLETAGGNAQNAVIMETGKPLNVTTPVTLSIPLPSGFVSNTNDIYVQHKGYEYTAAVTDNNGDYTATFTNPHGFSEFTISTASQTVATLNGESYTDFQAAVNAAQDGDTIIIPATATPDTFTATISGTSSKSIKVSNETSESITVTINDVSQTIAGNAISENFTYTYTPSYPTGGGGSSTPSYSTTVEKTENGTVTVAPQNASKGTTVTVTVKPDDGFVLNTLTVTDANGSQVTLTDKGNGQYTFAMPASAVTVKAVFAKTAQTNPFTDVYASDYYYDAVLWAVENGVTNGMTATTFNPNVTVSRAQMVTFLWRAHGSPKVTAENPFTDVNANEYYYDAVLWAVANGVTNGTSPTTFSPNAAVTRSQAVTFQWRAAGSPAASGSSFADVAAGTWYTDAVTWAVANGITNGTSATTFSPDTAVSRAQAVTFLYRELK